MKDIKNKGKFTKAIHGGENPDKIHRGASVPIYQSSTFAFNNVDEGADLFAGKKSGYIYTRLGNPTIKALEDCVAELEGGHKSLATSSGMAAVTTFFLAYLNRGDHIIGTDALYGTSRMVIEKDFSRFGVEYSFIDTSNINEIKKNIKQNTKVIFIESPSNPTIKLTDIKACAGIAKKQKLILAVDNTFMSPYFQRPIELGADIVIHSMTKFLNGHADVVAGIIVSKKEEDYEKLRSVLNHFGGVIDPHQAWLVLRGIRSLPLRMERSQENAQKLADFLEKHSKVKWVSYPGLKSHPQYKLAKKQMEGTGSMISFEVKGGIASGKEVLNKLNVATLAVSLGGIETLIQHPASMSHASMPKEAREKAGITDGLIRISVGCEDYKDLEDDLKQALK